MPPTFSGGNQAVSASVQDVILAALYELGVQAQGEPLEAQDGAWGLQKLQREIDQFNARREMIFSESFLEFTLQANHAPHTIGPGGDFQLPIRPVEIISASFILNPGTANPVDAPIKIKDAAWWAAVPLKNLASEIVTDLYYDPAGPRGNLNFYPICNIANPVRLEMWNSLAQAVSLQTKLGFVQGYWDAVVTDLAVRLAPSYGQPVSPDLREQWNRAMRIVQANNNAPPRIDTNCGGLPESGRGGRPDFNFLTGLRE
ncbi:MAG: hypothetical protein ACRD20_20470 [Terriglobales bacterium]